MRGRTGISQAGRRAALFLAACALLLKIAVPAGWMPQANARGISLGWCSGSQHAVPEEARALLAKALGDTQKPAKPAQDQPCAFAPAAQPLASAEAIALPAPSARFEPALPVAITAIPGRGLAAPPPLSTGPPRLA